MALASETPTRKPLCRSRPSQAFGATTFDGQTVFSIIIGALLTIVTFWIGYKKTIGAAEERLLIALQTAKSYQNSVPVQRLISFADVLAIVFVEATDNIFLDAPSKTTVISLID